MQISWTCSCCGGLGEGGEEGGMSKLALSCVPLRIGTMSQVEERCRGRRNSHRTAVGHSTTTTSSTVTECFVTRDPRMRMVLIARDLSMRCRRADT